MKTGKRKERDNERGLSTFGCLPLGTSSKVCWEDARTPAVQGEETPLVVAVR